MRLKALSLSFCSGNNNGFRFIEVSPLTKSRDTYKTPKAIFLYKASNPL